MNERELLVDCLRRLNRTGVTYYLTGSMASNYWGIPRTTHDLACVIQPPPSGRSSRRLLLISTLTKRPCARPINPRISSCCDRVALLN